MHAAAAIAERNTVPIATIILRRVQLKVREIPLVCRNWRSRKLCHLPEPEIPASIFAGKFFDLSPCVLARKGNRFRWFQVVVHTDRLPTALTVLHKFCGSGSQIADCRNTFHRPAGDGLKRDGDTPPCGQPTILFRRELRIPLKFASFPTESARFSAR